MVAAHYVEAGILGAVVIFFVLERTGILYKWLDKVEHWGE